SSNGTRVQGNRIASGIRVPLPAGSIVEVAGTIVHVRRGSAVATDDDGEGGEKSVSAGTKRRKVILQDRRMTELYQLAERVAASSMSVLVLGETGVGKELLAERIHLASPRRERPFLRVNCAALAEGVLASELFGHERGAFTGAHATKIGLFETANG